MQVGTSLVVGALRGQQVVIRYPRVPETSKDKREDAILAEAAKSIPHALSEVFLDWDILSEVDSSGKKQLQVMLVAAKHSDVQSRVQLFDAAGVQPGVFSVDSLALVDAAEACGGLHEGETIALLNIGLKASNLHFVKDGKSNFIREINWGSLELVQAVVRERSCTLGEAEQILQDEGMAGYEEEDVPESVIIEPPEAMEASEPPEPEPIPEPIPEPVQAKDDPFGNMFGGGGSALDPLDSELGGSGDLGASKFGANAFGGNAFGGNATPMNADAVKKELSDIIAGPLSKMIQEVRRSFDYFEHQLFERPVDRLVLCGGIAQLPLVGEMLLNELGVKTVETADPSRCDIMLADDVSVMPMLEQPAQFMVAVGLAARGMAEL